MLANIKIYTYLCSINNNNNLKLLKKMKEGKRIINNEYFARQEKLAKLIDLLKSITVYSWYCGHVTALYAVNNDCTVEYPKDRTKVRRLLKKNGYVAHFNGGILSVEC